MYLSLAKDKNRIGDILNNWVHDDVQIIVVTDGSRILGLGDLGVNGMGIPIGKLSLYVAGSGFCPTGTLPIALDTGTNTDRYLTDPEYLGHYTPRSKGDEYLAFLDEFMSSVQKKWPSALVQFEDFTNDHAFLLLERYRHQYRCFNDDIQGTGAVVCSGFINSLRVANVKPQDVRIVFLGAGSAGVGVADMIVRFICSQTGVTPEQARTQIWFVDSRGLLTSNRGGSFEPHKIPYLRHDNGDRQISDLYEILEYVRPNALIGLSGIGGSFTDKVFFFSIFKLICKTKNNR
jgi:malate dehydrogenase (oxaloacetate-decarboxylating)(NADP+)